MRAPFSSRGSYDLRAEVQVSDDFCAQIVASWYGCRYSFLVAFSWTCHTRDQCFTVLCWRCCSARLENRPSHQQQWTHRRGSHALTNPTSLWKQALWNTGGSGPIRTASGVSQGRIQKYGLGGREGVASRPLPSPSPPVSLPVPSSPLPLEVGPLIQLRGLGSAVSSTSWSM